MVEASGTRLTAIVGISDLVAARILGEVGTYADSPPSTASLQPPVQRGFRRRLAVSAGIGSTAAVIDVSTVRFTPSHWSRLRSTFAAVNTCSAGGQRARVGVRPSAASSGNAAPSI